MDNITKHLTTVLLVASLGYFVFAPSVLTVAVVLGIIFLRGFEIVMESRSNAKVAEQIADLEELFRKVDGNLDVHDQKFNSRIQSFVTGANMFVTNLNAITFKLGLGEGLKQVTAENFGGDSDGGST